MPRVLIAGCGYVGEAAANHFQAHGWEVEGWTGSAESAAKLAGRFYTVRPVNIAYAVAPIPDVDVVIQSVSSRGGDEKQYRRLYLDGAQNLCAAFPDATLLFTSSTSVYAQRDGSVVNEKSAAEPPHAKGMILRESEEVVRQAGGIVLRLGGIHGPGRSAIVTKFLRGEATGGNADRFINQIHRDDIVSALLLLAERRHEYPGEIFNVVGDHPIKAAEAYEWLGPRLRRPIPTGPGNAVPSKRGESNKRVSNEKLRATGWTPRYPTFEVAMSESILASFGF
jgi:nucleoside-diphosphate-sugar epimerase